MQSIKDISRRRDSVVKTGQITRAMQLVATAKLQKIRDKAAEIKIYGDEILEITQSVLSSSTIKNDFTKSRGTKKGVILISSNRGLAGGYNTNIVKEMMKSGIFTKPDTSIYAIGTRGEIISKRYGYNTVINKKDLIEKPSYEEAIQMTQYMLKEYKEKQIDEIYIIYTHFKNVINQEPTIVKLLPMDNSIQRQEGQPPINYDMEEEELLDILIPKYMSSVLYSALLQSQASENGARMTAMEGATKNAKELMEDLQLKYNRARQSTITNELIEIVSGAETHTM